MPKSKLPTKTPTTPVASPGNRKESGISEKTGYKTRSGYKARSIAGVKPSREAKADIESKVVPGAAGEKSGYKTGSRSGNRAGSRVRTGAAASPHAGRNNAGGKANGGTDAPVQARPATSPKSEEKTVKGQKVIAGARADLANAGDRANTRGKAVSRDRIGNTNKGGKVTPGANKGKARAGMMADSSKAITVMQHGAGTASTETPPKTGKVVADMKKGSARSPAGRQAKGSGARRRRGKLQQGQAQLANKGQLLDKDLVLHQLQVVNRPLEVEELSRQLNLTDLDRLLLILKELEREGEVVRTRTNRYGVAKKMNLSVGVLQGHPKGFAFLIPDDKSEDIYISKENLGGGMHGDRVVARPLGFGLRGRRTEGEVIRILERANERVVGRFETSGNQFGFVVPDEKKLGWDIFVSQDHQQGARNGDKVVVEITRWPEDRRNPEGKIVEAFGASGEPGVDILSIIKKYGLPEEFPPRILQEAGAISQDVATEDEDGRWDLRELPMVTIDGEDAKDLDDAVSLEKLDNGNFRLGVHIADVSYYVREDSELDKEAFQRGTSVYLVDRVIPMLPQSLSNGICSLNAGVDRLAVSVFMEINREGHVVRYEIGPAVIRVDERMTYTNVRRILDERDAGLCQRYADFVETFDRMRDLCLILRERRHQRGALDFDFPECKVYLDESGRPMDVCLMEQSIANQIIEEFMLMANETVAQHLFHLDVPLLYRVHEEPKEEKLTALNEFLHGFGYHIPTSGGVHPRFFQDILTQVEGRPEQQVVHMVILRSLQHARYAPAPLGHFGLAVEFYTHFTSPIRRYPDLIVHR
ncbi:MAG: ribonuclease R, partial [Thermacetogeniaceae bacterium]